MKFITIATAALSFFASCTLAAPLDVETGISPLAVRAGTVDVVVPNSDLLVKKAVDDIASLNDGLNDLVARGADVDVVLNAIVDITAQVKVIIAKLSVKGIVIADVNVYVPQLVDLLVQLKVQIAAVKTWNGDVVDISVQLNALIVLILDVFISLKVDLGLDVLVDLIANVQVNLQALIDVCLVVVVGLDVQLLPLLSVSANILVVLGINLSIGGILVGLLGLL